MGDGREVPVVRGVTAAEELEGFGRAAEFIRRAMLVDVEKGCENVTETDDNEQSWIPLADGVGMCCHIGTLTRSIETTDGEPGERLRYHRSVCSRCGGWANALYWPAVVPPVVRHVPGLKVPRPTIGDLFADFLALLRRPSAAPTESGPDDQVPDH